MDEIEMKMHTKRIVNMIMGLLAVASLLIIFKDGVFSIVDKIIIPISSSVRQDSYAILVFAILFVVFAYLANGLLLYRKNYVKHPDHTFCLVSVTAIFYSLFRFGDHYVFYGVGHITYVDGVFATIAIMEVLSYIFPSKRIDVSKVTEKANGFVSDSPSKIDLLGREDYAERGGGQAPVPSLKIRNLPNIPSIAA